MGTVVFVAWRAKGREDVLEGRAEAGSSEHSGGAYACR